MLSIFVFVFRANVWSTETLLIDVQVKQGHFVNNDPGFYLGGHWT